MSNRYNIPQYRIVVLGDGGVGKTCLTSRLCLQYFIETYDPTLEDSYRKQCQIDDETCMLEVLDTAGQEEYTALREQWIRDGDVYVLVYSITSRSTFEGIRKFYRQMQQVRSFPPASANDAAAILPIVLVGNKSDVAVRDRAVSTQEAEALARELRVGFVETSAKDGTNVERAFFDAVRRLKRQQQREYEMMPDGPPERKTSRSSHAGGGAKWKGRLTRIFGSSGKHGS